MIGIELQLWYLQGIVTALVVGTVSYSLVRDAYRTQRKLKERPGVLQLNWTWRSRLGADTVPAERKALPAPKQMAPAEGVNEKE